MLVTAALVVLTGCGKNVYERVADGAPIKPVHMHGESMKIYLTDYVPLLAADGLVPETMTVTGSDLAVIELGKAYVVVLPDKPMTTGLVATGCTKTGKVQKIGCWR